MLSQNDFISVDELIAEVALNIGDEEFKLNGRSYYLMLAHRAVEELAIQSFYQTVTKDIFDWNCNNNLMFDIPANAFNLKELVFFNLVHKTGCSCTDAITSKDCWADFRIAHFKEHYNSFGSTGVRTAKITSNTSGNPTDAVYRDYFSGNMNKTGFKSELIYFGIQNGSYTMSNAASSYSNCRIVYNGMGSDNDKLPCIPRIFRNALIDWSVERALSRLKVGNKQYRADWIDSKSRLNGEGRTMGSWERAKRIAKMSDKKVKNDYEEYLANPFAK